ncbi:MAG TPA: hypothetical protein DDY57_10385 [Franconibacter pulveris]|nr:hypothetical protein [Franconibacter pulveris]
MASFAHPSRIVSLCSWGCALLPPCYKPKSLGEYLRRRLLTRSGVGIVRPPQSHSESMLLGMRSLAALLQAKILGEYLRRRLLTRSGVGIVRPPWMQGG